MSLASASFSITWIFWKLTFVGWIVNSSWAEAPGLPRSCASSVGKPGNFSASAIIPLPPPSFFLCFPVMWVGMHTSSLSGLSGICCVFEPYAQTLIVWLFPTVFGPKSSLMDNVTLRFPSVIPSKLPKCAPSARLHLMSSSSPMSAFFPVNVKVTFSPMPTQVLFLSSSSSGFCPSSLAMW